MSKSAHLRTNIVEFLAIVVLSAVTMLWLFWRYPVTTGIAAIVLLAAFALSARVAQWMDPEGKADLDHGEQGA